MEYLISEFQISTSSYMGNISKIDAPLKMQAPSHRKGKAPNTNACRGSRLARPGGFEPPASRIGICCDIQLRHGRLSMIGNEILYISVDLIYYITNFTQIQLEISKDFLSFFVKSSFQSTHFV